MQVEINTTRGYESKYYIIALIQDFDADGNRYIVHTSFEMNVRTECHLVSIENPECLDIKKILNKVPTMIEMPLTEMSIDVIKDQTKPPEAFEKLKYNGDVVY